MTAPGKISIGLPVYNAAATIGRTIESLQAQTYANIEICISDNASTDGTLEIIKTMAQQDSRIRWVVQDSNLGVAKNFHAVSEMAEGEYFCWAASDDRYLPQFLEALYGRLAADPEAKAAMCATLLVNEHGETVKAIRYKGSNSPEKMSRLKQAGRLISAHPTIKAMKYNLFIMGLYRRAFVQAIVRSGEDALILGDRIIPATAALGGGLLYVDEQLYIRTRHARGFRERYAGDPLLKTKNIGTWQYAWRVQKFMLSTAALQPAQKLLSVALTVSMVYRAERDRLIHAAAVAVPSSVRQGLPDPVRQALRKLLFYRS
jgi:glycosyltransferase involved in cell wall biosynthesis